MSNYSDSSFNESETNTSWKKVFDLIPERSKVLDVGCSSGNFGDVLKRKKVCVVDGIELDSSDAKEASTKLRKVFIKNVETDSLEGMDKDYDIIYFGDVIEHLVDPVPVLKKIKNHLNSRGKVVFSIPNMAHISVRLMLLGGDFEYTETGLLDKTHLHFYTQSEVSRVFADSGYKIDQLQFVVKDYPKDLIQRELSKSGLKASSVFFDIAKKPNASAFQFVGSASRSNNAKPKTLKEFGPIDMFESYHNDIVSDYKRQLKDLESLKKENLKLRGYLEDIKKRPHVLVYKKIKSKLKS